MSLVEKFINLVARLCTAIVLFLCIGMILAGASNDERIAFVWSFIAMLLLIGMGILFIIGIFSVAIRSQSDPPPRTRKSLPNNVVPFPPTRAVGGSL